MSVSTELTRFRQDQGVFRRWGISSLVAGLVGLAGIGASPPAEANAIAAALAANQAVAQTQMLATEQVRSRPNIEPELLATLQSGKPQELAIYFERPDLSAAHGMDWKARGKYVVETLQQAAERSQKPLREQMLSNGYSFKSFWIDNVLLVENGDIGLFDSLSRYEGVKQVTQLKDMELFVPKPVPEPYSSEKTINPIPNLVRVKAPEAWALGATGTNAVVGIIDQGPRHSHEALRGAYRGNIGGGNYDHDFNYLNPYALGTIGAPGDHGTHTTGSAIGSTPTQTIGMAPDAKWIGCRGCATSSCGGPELLQCAQFMAAPTTLSFTNPDPDLRPHVVNNSWGSCQQTYDGWYQGVVDSWVAAGIVPVFSNGNASNCGYSSPPGLNTAGNPGRYGNVLGIGSSSNNTGTYAPHSNWGPTDNPNPGTPDVPDPRGYPSIKPNVIAPGVNILSSVSASDTAYQSSGWTGTSMSAPHVAGMVAQMISAAPCLEGEYGILGTIIMETAVGINYDSGGNPAPGPNNIPNYATGWGEIDAEAAVIAAVGMCGPRGTIAGTVTDANTTNPIEGVAITIINPAPPPPSYTLSSGVDGSYERMVGITENADTYSIEFSRYGYLPDTVTGVTVLEDTTTTVDIALTPAPMFTVSGTITDDAGGWPLHARIDIDGYPDGVVWTDPVTGAYSVDLAGGIEYTFSVTANVPGYDSTARAVGPLMAPATEDFAVSADLVSCAAPGYLASTFFSEDFESDNGGFTLSGPTPAPWQWGAPSAWPNGCTSGANCWGTNLSGSYVNNANQTLSSPVIDTTGLMGDARISWRQAHHIETHTFDRAFAEYRIDGGAWVEMWRNPSATAANGWSERSFIVSGFSGSTLELQFRFSSDGSVIHPGWFIDDLQVTAASDCAPQVGGYVLGTTRDANTTAPLNGVTVSPSDGTVSLSATSADPAQGDGFYMSWVAAGNQSLSASYPLYGHTPVAVTVADTINQRVDLSLGTGNLTVDPASLSETLELGQNTTVPLTVTNNGTAPATVSLAAIGSLPEDFETAFPPSGWSVFNEPGTTAGCGWKRNDAAALPNYAGDDGFAAAANSDDCGAGTTTDSSLISPPLDFGLSATVGIDYVVAYRHLGSSALRLDVSTDGGGSWTTVETYSASVDPTGPGRPESIDLSTELGGQSNARIRFRYSGGYDWWAVIDQVSILSSVPWLSIDPSAGTFVTPFGSTQLMSNVTFDASQVPAPGVYTTQIFVEHNTPNPVPPVPVTMTVTAPASFGQLVGTVSGLGYCGINPATLEGASVTVTSNADTYPLTTDASGNYSIFLEATEGPVDIAVTADGHEAGSVTGIALVASGVSGQDFDLGALLGCTSGANTPLSVTLESGGNASEIVTLGNSGLGGASFSTSEAAPITQLMIDLGPAGTRVASGSLRSAAQGTHQQLMPISAQPTGATISLGILSPDTLRPTNLASLLSAFPEITASVIPAASLPGLGVADLAGFDVVLLHNNNQWLSTGGVSPAQVGDVLADYVDAGGRVIAAHYANDFTGWEIGGRFITSGYLPFLTATADRPAATYTLGTVLEPGHPVMSGIATLSVSGGAAVQATGIRPGATEIARWNNGDPLVAANADGTVVALNALVGDVGGGFNWTGQFAELIRNSADFLAVEPFDAPWLEVTPVSGSVLAGATSDVTIDFTALPELAAGTYDARVLIAVDDGGGNTSNIEIPVSLTVIIEADLAITLDASANPVGEGQSFTYGISVENLGPSASSGISVAVALPTGGQYDGYSGAGWTCIAAGSDLDCELAGSLASTAISSLTLDYSAGAAGTLSLSAEVSSADSVDSVPSNNMASLDVEVQGVPAEDLIFQHGFED